MKKKPGKNIDVTEVMTHIQEQLAMMNEKLDAFMTKSLTELAGALAAQKQAAQPRPVPPPATAAARHPHPAGRTMYTVVCYQCGKDSEIPFKPSGDRPVYCPECFAKRKAEKAAARIGGMITPPPAAPAPAPAVKTPAPAAKAATKKAPAAKRPVAKKASVKKSATKKKAATKKKK